MYHGTNKTALASQKQITEALYDLMQEKDYADISVSEMCKRAGVSRQTFYTLFQTKENVVAGYLADRIYMPEEGDQSDGIFSLEDFCLQFSRYLTRNKAFLALLVDNGIAHLLCESMQSAMDECDFFLSHLEAADRQYITRFIASGFAGIATTYVTRGASDSEEVLRDKIRMLFRGEYIPQ